MSDRGNKTLSLVEEALDQNYTHGGRPSASTIRESNRGEQVEGEGGEESDHNMLIILIIMSVPILPIIRMSKH